MTSGLLCWAYVIILFFLFANDHVHALRFFTIKKATVQVRHQQFRSLARRWIAPFKLNSRDKSDIGIEYAVNVPSHEQKPSNELQIIISGAPAAGKGTQCEFIKSKFDVVHISTGELLRSAMRDKSDLGNEVRVYMDAGKLVPDNIIISVVCARLSQSDCQQCGWLLDGFPRTKAQADALFNAGHIADCFVQLNVSETILLDRITGRRTDPLTGKVYHLLHNPPNDLEIEKRMIQRSDDTAEKLLNRYADYHRHIGAISSYYEDRTIVVDGGASKETISKHLQKVLTQIKHAKASEEAPNERPRVRK